MHPKVFVLSVRNTSALATALSLNLCRPISCRLEPYHVIQYPSLIALRLVVHQQITQIISAIAMRDRWGHEDHRGPLALHVYKGMCLPQHWSSNLSAVCHASHPPANLRT
ncbi:hypothetical protein EV424DRAFT_1369842 [Suillus variegatus]|nr:hypothetical protein EV424DRAFT_1454630 [Suillus variegatus]KAG1832135.1 hypothetical protein EV424DRAFT_1369842 [Suillus variegatus]